MNDADMIEAMARAICARSADENRWKYLDRPAKDRFRHRARAALAVVQPELDRLRAENARLRSALEPFASRADRYDPVDNDDGEPDWSTAAPSIRIGDLRRARAAVEKANG